MYSVWDGEELVAVASVDKIPKSYAIIDDVWVKKNKRGQKLFSRLLWFLKTREGYDQLLLGKIHSKDTVEVVKGMSRFKKSWVKRTMGQDETRPFSQDTLDQFYSTGGPTGWQLMLENTHDFGQMPRFSSLESGYVLQNYTQFIE